MPETTPPTEPAATTTSTGKRTKNFTVGDVVELDVKGPNDITVVTLPDGSTVNVAGPAYVLSQPGEFLLGDRPVSAK